MCRMISVIVMSVLFVIPARSQSFEVEQLLLNVEKLTQLRQILDNMYKGYEVLHKGYTAIKDISEGNFSIHKLFLDKLLQVSPVVMKYKRIADIINSQLRMAEEYKKAFARFKKSGNFSEAEITYMSRVYKKLLEESAQQLEELLMIITANQVRMTDDERLHAIDKIYDGALEQLSFLRHFNNSTAMLGMQRMGEQQDVDVMRKVYGIK